MSQGANNAFLKGVKGRKIGEAIFFQLDRNCRKLLNGRNLASEGELITIYPATSVQTPFLLNHYPVRVPAILSLFPYHRVGYALIE